VTLLEKLWRDHGLTMVLVTHDSSVVRHAQRVGVIHKGKLSVKRDIRPRAVPG
jgi:putative ABC transport system ATP-binding protein